MELKELLLYREQLISESRDAEGYISDAGFLDICLPSLNETKFTDTSDVTPVFDPLENGSVKVNAYCINESGERLQLFLVNEESLLPDLYEEQVMVSQKSAYEKQMTRALTFLKKSIKKQMGELLQDASPAGVLVQQLGASEFLDQIDVVELFLISATATVETRGAAPGTKMMEFEDEPLSVHFTLNGDKKSKTITVKKRLIDLNFLYQVTVSEGGRYPLIVDFSKPPFYPVPFLRAADEPQFDSYLCALPAEFLANLYEDSSSRLLEKNVRSFLQLKGVNKGMQDTIRKEPEKFIAYNNGLTITATDCEITEYNGQTCIKSLSDFQIVNGGQTTATLYFSRKAGLPVGNINVMTKINVAKNASEEDLDELISKISLYSNAQSKVTRVDLRARSSQLVKLKSLSESVLTVSGKKWFFERAKGEYATMVRVNNKRKSNIEKMYPKERRFTKEELAKYYASWGNKPYAVKRGGEKIFRIFLEEISGEGSNKKAVSIDRNFYEDLIARIILFRSLETIYGAGSNSMGQLRSAAVPYSISALYQFTTGDKKSHAFDLLKIWKSEMLEPDLQTFFRNLMELVNTLIKQYSLSEDFGEYSKKAELWNDISGSKQLAAFMISNAVLLRKYTVSAQDLKKRDKERSEQDSVDFEPLIELARIFDRGEDFYKKIESQTTMNLTHLQQVRLSDIIACIQNHRNIDESNIKFSRDLVNYMSRTYPDLIPEVQATDIYSRTALFIMKKYNSAVAANDDIASYFDAVKEFARKKDVKYYSVFGEIGKKLKDHELPSISQLLQAFEMIRNLTESD